MNPAMLAIFNGWEMIMIMVVVLILFGPKKLPELARGLGKGLNEFKKASREVTDELHSAMEAEPTPPPRRAPAPQPAPAPAAAPVVTTAAAAPAPAPAAATPTAPTHTS